MRMDQWSNTVVIDGRPFGVWDTLDGGESDSEETKYRPGGMKPQVSLGGSRSIGNLTLSRLLSRPDWTYARSLMSRTGQAKCVVSRQPLDTDGNPWGTPLTYRGTLKTVTPGGSDSNSSDAQTWEIVISTEGSVA
jgi:hypothetical protein